MEVLEEKMLVELSPLVNEVPDGPLVASGTIDCGYDNKILDIQVNILPVHPSIPKDLERFKGKRLSISIPELTLEDLQLYSEEERDKMRYTEQYALVCRKLGFDILRVLEERNLKVDYALAVDHAGQLITMFVAKIADIESYEIRRIKKKRDDGTIDLTILLPQSLYPIDGKRFLLLDEFINTGFTLREAIKTIQTQGGHVSLIGAFKRLEGGGKLLDETYPDIPIITLE
jgi:orotate phosphoribosyltransferase